MSEIKVNSIKGVSASVAALSINNTDGTCTANLTNRTNKNLVVNGACLVSQRGTSSTSTGYLIDRVEVEYTGLDEAATVAQVDVASGTTPYTLGFRKAYKITNGNQTSGAGAGDRFQTFLKLEAQDIANSGWNYTSSSSYITLQFWVKSSVAQNFYGYLRTKDGTSQRYVFETGSLTADTWTKITKTIPGNSNITINNDNGEGLQINLQHFSGTDLTDSGVSLNAWGAYVGTQRTPDQTSTWYTTNDSTLEYTGFQLEVGSVVTDFEHRSFGQELALCQRYFYMHVAGTNVNGNDEDKAICTAVRWDNSNFYGTIFFPVYMRAKPTIYSSLGTDKMLFYKVGSTDGVDSIGIQEMGYANGVFSFSGGLSSSAPNGWMVLNNNDSYIGFSAEL